MKRIALLLGILIAGAILFSCAPGPVTPVEKKPAELAAPLIKTGWEVEWEKTLQAARKEGRVVVYSTFGAETRTALVRGFKDRYGISLEVIIAKGAEASEIKV